MNRSTLLTTLASTAIAAGALTGSGRSASAADYTQTNLVSDISGLATITDPTLTNPWGISRITTPFSSPFWISDQGTNATTLYGVTGSTNVTKVNINPPSGDVLIPTTASGPQGPTGQVSNTNSSSFAVGNGGDRKSALFIFANLNGTVSAWDGGTTAITQWTTPGAVYTGLAINGADTRLYAANDAGAGSIDVFNSSFAPVSLGSAAFKDPHLPSGLVPFNVQDINGKVYVTYAPAGHQAQTTAPLGAGVVDVYSEAGAFEQRLVTGGQLASPWGVALAPNSFGKIGGDLLIGNFSFDHSEINAFDPSTGAFEGTIAIDPGAGDMPGGLWALAFGGGGANGSPNTLYFTDGIDGETAGLFGAIAPSVPETSTWAMMLAGFVGLGLAAFRCARKTGVALAFE
jgi:uncharacterized protein (TIGR03118 family)